MKRLLCAMITIMMLLGCACAEEMTAEAWQHEAGWISFSLAMSQDGMEEAWDAGAKVFGESIGMPLTGEQLKMMTLQGYQLENGVDELSVEGSRFTGRTQDGTTLFDHEYAWTETLEDKDIMGGTKVYVFRTEEAGAGEYTYLLMTEPVKTENESTGYVTFNLLYTQRNEYRQIFDLDGKGTAMIPCAMIEKDTGADGLAFAIERLYGQPVVLK